MAFGPDDDGLPTEQEYETARLLVAAHIGRATRRHPFTLEDLLGLWAELTTSVEEGYDSTPPELDNELWCRDALATVWPLLPHRVRAAKQTDLIELDQRYRAATIAWPGQDDEPRWWIWRIPRRLASWPDEPRGDGWPADWKMMPFPKPDSVEVV